MQNESIGYYHRDRGFYWCFIRYSYSNHSVLTIQSTFSDKKRTMTFFRHFLLFYLSTVVVIMRNISPSDSTADLRSDSVAKSLNFSKKTAFNISDLPQPLTVCGQFDMNRIVGGDVAGILEFPWLALIEHTRGENVNITVLYFF